MNKIKNKIIARCGDVDPIFNSGAIVIQSIQDNIIYHDMEYTNHNYRISEQGYRLKNNQNLVYRGSIEKLIPNWLSENKIKDVSNYSDNNILLLDKNSNWLDWLIVYCDIYDYFGWINLDNYPNIYNHSRIKKDWKLYK